MTNLFSNVILKYFTLLFINIRVSLQNDLNLESDSFQRPLHYQEAVNYIYEKIKYKNFQDDFDNLASYEILAHFKNQLDYWITNTDEESIQSFKLMTSISKPCIEKMVFFFKEFKLNEEWTKRGYLIIKN